MGLMQLFRRKEKPLLPPVVIHEDHCFFCEHCHHFFGMPFWENIDQCQNPNCKSTDIKHASSWMRTPGEQKALLDAHQKKPSYLKALNGRAPLPLLRRTILSGDDAA